MTTNQQQQSACGYLFRQIRVDTVLQEIFYSLLPLELNSRMSDISYIITLSKTNSVTCELLKSKIDKAGQGRACLRECGRERSTEQHWGRGLHL